MLYKYQRPKKYNIMFLILSTIFPLLLLFFLVKIITVKPQESIVSNTNEVNEPFVFNEDKIKHVNSNAESILEKKEYTSDMLEIMGYKKLDKEQAYSWILSSFGNDIDKKTSMMDLNGLTLEEHLENLDKVAKAEDVDPNFVLVQQVKETGYFTFRRNVNGKYVLNSVLPSYYNFAGLGAVDDKSVPPEKFNSNIEGQLAQVQHLKGYATTDEMNTEVVDNRLKYIGDNRGTVTTAADLSKRWASDPIYGQELAKLYTDLINHNISTEIISGYARKTYGPLPENL